MISCTDILIGLITTFGLLYLYFKWSFSYWNKRNVPSLPAKFLLGNLENPLTNKTSQPVQFWNIYNEFKKMGVKHGGVYMFASPVYVPLDLDIVKRILTQDSHYFDSRGFYNNENQPISMHLFALSGDRWRNLRRKLTPTFTSGKMKMMCESVVSCGVPLKGELMKYKNRNVNIKDTLSKFTMNVIGTCAFGVNCNAFEDTDSDFLKYSKSIVKPTFLEVVKDMVCFAFPNFSRTVNLKPFNDAAAKFYTTIVHDLVNYRIEKNESRKDYMQLLIDLINNNSKDKNGEDNFDIDCITAQAFLFFIAGFETSSSTTTYCLYELARHPKIQEKVRQEISEVLAKYDGKCPYEALTEMKYLSQVIEETLRLYPIIPILTRQCTKSYKVPDTDLVIEEGMMAVISALGIHRNEDIYPDPEKFDPERYSEANRQNVNPYSILGFGEGPRNCIGSRFGIMQVKVGLVTLLQNFKFSVNPRTKEPLEFDSSFILSVKGDIWLDVTGVNG